MELPPFNISNIISPVKANGVTPAPQRADETSFFQVIKNLTKTAQGDQVAVPHLQQGENECGPTSLAMIMKYYGLNPGNYHKMFSSDTVGHGPLALREKARIEGLTARQENNGSLEDLAALVDKGIPPLVLGIYGGGANSSLNDYLNNAGKAHWMVVTGYQRDVSGAISQVSFNDPNKTETQSWSAWNFTNKFWDNNIIPGGHRYYLALAKKGTFQDNLLRAALPQDKISISFDSFLHATDQLETNFYAAEQTANNFTDKIKGWFS